MGWKKSSDTDLERMNSTAQEVFQKDLFSSSFPEESRGGDMSPAREPPAGWETRAGRRTWGSGSKTKREESPEAVA